MHDLLFYGFGGSLILFSALVVLAPNLVHAAIALVASFFMTVGLYILFEMEFVAVSQIMVYIGGIVIFVVITILLTTRLGENHLLPPIRQRIWGMLIAGTLLCLLLLVAMKSFQFMALPVRDIPAGTASLATVGARLLQPTENGFIVPFELISVLLLIALIGAVVIARKDPRIEEERP
jgi:NADH-quinone oxidoreductase subunit J